MLHLNMVIAWALEDFKVGTYYNRIENNEVQTMFLKNVRIRRIINLVCGQWNWKYLFPLLITISTCKYPCIPLVSCIFYDGCHVWGLSIMWGVRIGNRKKNVVQA